MNNNVNNLAKSGLLLAIAIIFQALGKALPQVSQVFVGPIVNAVLIIAVAVCGLWYGIVIGALTPLLAWILGQLPAPFGPFVPFIIIGNIIFVLFFYVLKNYKYGEILGIITGALFKFLFLFFSATTIVKALKLIVNTSILNKLALAMGVLQFVTAIAGGILAIILLTLLRNRKQIN